MSLFQEFQSAEAVRYAAKLSRDENRDLPVIVRISYCRSSSVCLTAPPEKLKPSLSFSFLHITIQIDNS